MPLDLQRGDIVVCSQQGDYDKPQPAVVVQSDLFNSTHASIVLCPITSHIVDTPLFRLNITKSVTTGLKQPSQIMVDKITTIKSNKIKDKIGNLSINEMQSLDNALKLWLNL